MTDWIHLKYMYDTIIYTFNQIGYMSLSRRRLQFTVLQPVNQTFCWPPWSCKRFEIKRFGDCLKRKRRKFKTRLTTESEWRTFFSVELTMKPFFLRWWSKWILILQLNAWCFGCDGFMIINDWDSETHVTIGLQSWR